MTVRVRLPEGFTASEGMEVFPEVVFKINCCKELSPIAVTFTPVKFTYPEVSVWSVNFMVM